MPEGDTIYRAAAKLRPVMVSREIRSAAVSRRYTSGPDALELPRLCGQVGRVESRGKHLLIHLASGWAIHSHLGMTGAWHVYAREQRWKKPKRRAALTLEFGGHTVVCFSPKTLELLSPARLRQHPHLNRLGPDLLSEDWDEESAMGRLRVHDQTPLGEAIMNQTLICGIGNVYKSEVLFLQQLDPLAPVRCLSDQELRESLRTARKLMRRNLGSGPRRTRFAGDSHRVWVYDRHGEPCFRCGELIQVTRQGDLGRTTYFCPDCQRVMRRPR